MLTVTLTDEQWQKMLLLLRAHPERYVGQEGECRRFLRQGYLFKCRGGYFPSNMVIERHSPPVRALVGAAVSSRSFINRSPTMLTWRRTIDSTIVRAHPCKRPARRKARRAS